MPPGDFSSDLEELKASLKELEHRVSALEDPWPMRPREPKLPAGTPAAHFNSDQAPPAQPSVFSVFGKAVLGIAGAYVLRAAEESRILPAWIAVALALAYAAAWLVWSAWPSVHSQLARYTYAITAALILAPMLWEVTVRFQILPPPATAAILAAFALLAMTLAWRSHVSAVVWVGILAAMLTALIVMVAAHAPVPFTFALLFLALLAEVAAIRGHWRALRPVVATTADFAVLLLTIILGNPRAIPHDYRPAGMAVVIAIAALLFGIYATSLAIRSLILPLKISPFEIAQFTIAVLLAIWAVLRITEGAGLLALGVSCLIFGAASYFAAFRIVARHLERPNFHFYAVWSIVFVMAGSFFALPHVPLVLWLCLAALIATVLGVTLQSPALELHSVAYLTGMAAASGLIQQGGRSLLGAYPPAFGALLEVAAAATLVCAAIVSRYPGERRAERLLRLLPAALAVFAAAALAVSALVWVLARGAALPPSQLAVVRNVVACSAALLLAFVGARRKRLELVWIAYGAAILGSLKLTVEDLRIGSTLSLAASLVIYGAVLILIPRLVRAGSRLA
jgi:hypothetical protein